MLQNTFIYIFFSGIFQRQCLRWHDFSTARKMSIETRVYYRIIVIPIMARSLEKNVLCFLPVRERERVPSVLLAQLPDESTLGCPCLHVKLFKRLSVNSLHFSYSPRRNRKTEGGTKSTKGCLNSSILSPICLFRRTFVKVSFLFRVWFTDNTPSYSVVTFHRVKVNQGIFTFSYKYCYIYVYYRNNFLFFHNFQRVYPLTLYNVYQTWHRFYSVSLIISFDHCIVTL